MNNESSSTSNLQDSDPVMLDSVTDHVSKPRGPLSAEEKSRRRTAGLCLYCGGAGHIAATCPLVSSRRQGNVNRHGWMTRSLCLLGIIQPQLLKNPILPHSIY